MKIGDKSKIEREYDAVIKYVNPTINGVGEPVYRVGGKKSLIVTQLAGLSSGSNATLISLKDYIKSASNPEELIFRLLNERLGIWYNTKPKIKPTSHNLGELFEWYLTKINKNIFPSEWSDLKSWVKNISGYGWKDVNVLASNLKGTSISSIATTIHGDMHSQNILIDEREECWPIDFAWCRINASPVLDFVMLECSLKFLALPQWTDLRSNIQIEQLLCEEALPSINVGTVPYSIEIVKVITGVLAIRKFAIKNVGISFEDYRNSLFLMTYVHSTHPLLNLPYVLSSLQILAAIVEKSK